LGLASAGVDFRELTRQEPEPRFLEHRLRELPA
jgi:hypothetical protein